MLGSIGMPELIVIFVIAMVVFGPRRLPELGRQLGRTINEFKRASAELQNTLEREIESENKQAASTPEPAKLTPAQAEYSEQLSRTASGERV